MAMCYYRITVMMKTEEALVIRATFQQRRVFFVAATSCMLRDICMCVDIFNRVDIGGSPCQPTLLIGEYVE